MSAAAKSSAWQNLGFATRRAVWVSVALLALSLGVVFLLLLPARQESRELAAKVAAGTADLDAQQARIRQTAVRRAEAESLEAELDALCRSGVLEPLLGSFEMRGMSLLNPLAERHGVALMGGSVRRLPQLPITEAAPAEGRYYARQPLEFTATGAYDQLAAFIRDVEREHPMATVSSLHIVAQPRDPDVQAMTIGIEWPVVAPPPPAPEKKKGRGK
ncbi:MAG: hypothetical protein ACOX9C_08140 [Kiritimatiellia bacterium]|jgi:hypothetical protein